MPATTVFGRILPALGIALPIGNLFYGYLAWSLAKREGRSDVTALPYGPSVPHMFIVVFVVMLPVYLKTKDPIAAWQAGLAWAFVIGIIIFAGAFVGPTVRKYTPRAAMLGALAGISIAFIALRPAFQSWQVPWLAFISLGIILVSWTARVRLPFGIPGGLAAVGVGTVLAWIATLTGISPVMDPTAVVAAIDKFGIHLPMFTTDALVGLSNIGPLLVTAVPLGIYNFTEGMNNVESASAAGDEFSLRKVLIADGIGAIAGSLLGSPFPPAVYIGHPGWKAVGGRIGYSIATGIVIALVCFLGLTALLLAIVPLVSILPILLYIGLVIGAQAFEATPARHAPAVIIALLPNVAEWAETQVDGALSAAGTSAAQVGVDKLAANGVIYHGMQLFGGGATLAGLILGAIAAFIIDRRFEKAGIYCLHRRGAGILRLHQRHRPRVRKQHRRRDRIPPHRGRSAAYLPGTAKSCPSWTMPCRRASFPNDRDAVRLLIATQAPSRRRSVRSRRIARTPILRSGSRACRMRRFSRAPAALEAEGPRGRALWGVPFAVKDNIDVAGHADDGGLPRLCTRSARERARRAARCSTRARSWSARPISISSRPVWSACAVPYGVPRNVFDAARVPGGSSSGSACAVAAGIVPFALGTDTAGSGRVPAVFGNIVGLKPTIGSVSTRGVVPACRSIDTISVFAAQRR